jgi:putative transposase
LNTLLTYKVKHGRDFSEELRKARQVAEYAIKTKSSTSTDVKHIGLKAAIANQILRKYGRNKNVKKVSRVNLTVPGQSIFVDRALKSITIPCLKLPLCYHFSGLEKVNQIEIDDEYAYISITICDSEVVNTGRYIGVDLNTTSHVAIASNPETGKVWKLGKQALHIHKQYREIRRRLQKQGKFRKVKQIKNKENNKIKNINHHISKKIVETAKTNGCGIRLEKLTNIRKTAKSGRSFKYALNSKSL